MRSRLPLLVEPEEAADEVAMNKWTAEDAEDPGDVIPDERLRLIFTCCHPALAQEAQVALTLRLLCGIPTPDIARAFLVSEPTVAARITRAKKKISGARPASTATAEPCDCRNRTGRYGTGPRLPTPAT